MVHYEEIVFVNCRIRTENVIYIKGQKREKTYCFDVPGNTRNVVYFSSFLRPLQFRCVVQCMYCIRICVKLSNYERCA